MIEIKKILNNYYNKLFNKKNIKILLFIPSIVLRIIVIYLPLTFLIRFFHYDDAYYFFQIAKNMVNNNFFISFDGINETNGFQPLWLIISYLSYLVTQNINIFIILIGYIELFISILSTYYLYKFTKLITKSNKISLIASLIFFYSVFIFLMQYNGMETSLYIMLLIITLYYYQKTKNNNYNYKNIFLTGTLLGLTIITRLDGVFLGLAIFIDIFLNIKKIKVKKTLINYVLILIPNILIISPYLIWSYFTFNSIAPSSTSVLSLVTFDFQTIVFRILKSLNYQNYVFCLYIILPFFIYYYIKKSDFRTFLFNKLFVFITFSALLYIFYTILFPPVFLYSRYFIPTSSLFIIISSYIIIYLFNDIKKIKSISFLGNKTFIFLFVFLLLVVSFLQIYLGKSKLLTRGNQFQVDSYNMSFWINNNINESDIISGWNCGVLGFFTKQKTINLDGVVNNEIRLFKNNNSIFQYLKMRNVSYIVDDIEYINNFMIKENCSSSLTFIYSINSVAIYKVK